MRRIFWNFVWLFQRISVYLPLNFATHVLVRAGGVKLSGNNNSISSYSACLKCESFRNER